MELRERAKSEGLWNLFMPDERYGAGLSNWEYGLLCEVMGRSLVAPMVYNCSAPDTGNMEILAEHGSEEQRERWLQPLLEDHIRSCFSMTEPETAGSDPTGLATRAELDGDEWVINGHKWFTSGAVGASLAIAMVVTDPDAAPHKRASMILVPTDTPGLQPHPPGAGDGPRRRPRPLRDRATTTAACPPTACSASAARGFKIAQDRLGPGRIHHCMRAIGGGRARLRDHVPARQRARGVRRQAGREAVRPGLRRPLARWTSTPPG